MVTKLKSKSAIGILIVLLIGAMVWQVAPVSAGFTPTPPPTAQPTIRPTHVPHPPTETPVPTVAAPTATPPSVLLPVTGVSAHDSGDTGIGASLLGMLVLLLIAVSLIIRKSASTKNG